MSFTLFHFQQTHFLCFLCPILQQATPPIRTKLDFFHINTALFSFHQTDSYNCIINFFQYILKIIFTSTDKFSLLLVFLFFNKLLQNYSISNKTSCSLFFQIWESNNHDNLNHVINIPVLLIELNRL